MRIVLGREGQSATTEGTLVDLSLGGAGIEHAEAWRPGERVVLSLASPERWDPLLVRATIVWCDGARNSMARQAPSRRLGVVFEHTGASEILDVLALLSSLAPS